MGGHGRGLKLYRELQDFVAQYEPSSLVARRGYVTPNQIRAKQRGLTQCKPANLPFAIYTAQQAVSTSRPTTLSTASVACRHAGCVHISKAPAVVIPQYESIHPYNAAAWRTKRRHRVEIAPGYQHYGRDRHLAGVQYLTAHFSTASLRPSAREIAEHTVRTTLKIGLSRTEEGSVGPE